MYIVLQVVLYRMYVIFQFVIFHYFCFRRGDYASAESRLQRRSHGKCIHYIFNRVFSIIRNNPNLSQSLFADSAIIFIPIPESIEFTLQLPAL